MASDKRATRGTVCVAIKQIKDVVDESTVEVLTDALLASSLYVERDKSYERHRCHVTLHFNSDMGFYI